MTNIQKGLCWAGAMLFVAAGAWSGIMDRDAAQTILLVMPVLAVTTLRNKPCRIRREA